MNPFEFCIFSYLYFDFRVCREYEFNSYDFFHGIRLGECSFIYMILKLRCASQVNSNKSFIMSFRILQVTYVQWCLMHHLWWELVIMIVCNTTFEESSLLQFLNVTFNLRLHYRNEQDPGHNMTAALMDLCDKKIQKSTLIKCYVSNFMTETLYVC